MRDRLAAPPDRAQRFAERVLGFAAQRRVAERVRRLAGDLRVSQRFVSFAQAQTGFG
ncbi:MAG: hypothetical protein U0703_11455 [Anaerolineae bacterium]